MNKITYRNLTFLDSDITSGQCNTQHAMTGESLAYDTLDFQVWDPEPGLEKSFITSDAKTFLTSDNEELLSLDNDFTNFTPGDPLMYYFDDVLINKFYLRDVKRVGLNLWNFSCVSAIGMLENSMHYGGMYSGTQITTVLAEIFDGLTYEVDPIVESILLYGWLPYASKRDNLQQITIATALSIRTKSDGSVLVTSLSSDTKGVFSTSRTVVGGNVEVGTPCTAVQVTEHSFSQSQEEITLFNEAFATEELILFQEPVHSLTITGGTIVSSSCNHAIVQGSGTVTLKGKKYYHNIKRITEGTVTGDSKDKVITVDNATLVTSLNSSKVAEKLYEVFSKPKSIKAEVLYGTERPGDVVEVINPYTTVVESATTRKMDIQFGSYLKASADFLVDYLPSGVIAGYKNKVVLSTNQTWAVPDGVTEIRAILIGGGGGGQGGFNGEGGTRGGRFPNIGREISDGTETPELYQSNGDGGNGGAGGAAGVAGNVLDTGALTVSPAQQFAAVIGAGGNGGASNGGAGSAGGNTTFGTYSSANGGAMSNGYVDILEANIYAIPGYAGTTGQNGMGKNNKPSPTVRDYTYKIYSLFGYSDVTKYAGFWTGYLYWYWKYTNGKYAYSICGNGGGSSYNANGGNGSGAEAEEPNGFVTGGNGGSGANGGTSYNATVYGSGGYGGHGGGGGGGGGAAANYGAGESYEWQGAGGSGGSGGTGGNGKSGCVIVYY